MEKRANGISRSINLHNVFMCAECKEIFDTDVWHCPVCNHHYPVEDIECGNCHYKPEDNKEIEVAK